MLTKINKTGIVIPSHEYEMQGEDGVTPEIKSESIRKYKDQSWTSKRIK